MHGVLEKELAKLVEDGTSEEEMTLTFDGDTIKRYGRFPR